MNLDFFQFVDRVLSITEAETQILAEATVPEDAVLFQTHFPSFPLFPATLLTETLAQSAGLLLLERNAFKQLPTLIRIIDAKARRPVTPGSRLHVDAQLIQDGSGYAVTKGKITLEDVPVFEAEMRFRIAPLENPADREMLVQYALATSDTAFRSIGLS